MTRTPPSHRARRSHDLGPALFALVFALVPVAGLLLLSAPEARVVGWTTERCWRMMGFVGVLGLAAAGGAILAATRPNVGGAPRSVPARLVALAALAVALLGVGWAGVELHFCDFSILP